MDLRVLLSCFIAVAASSLAIIAFYKLANAVGLVDRPGERKKHKGNIPLIGGISVFVGWIASLCMESNFPLFTIVLLDTAAVLMVVGVLDDRFDLSVRVRLLIQITAVLAMTHITGIRVHTLGHIFGYDVEFGILSTPITVFAVVGLINAFNLMDGIDGLIGTVTLVGIGAMTLYGGLTQWHNITILLFLAAALVPDMAANLGLAGRKIFLGDAGSTLLGYLMAWMLIKLSQGSSPVLSAVDVLWCVALPIMDTLAVIIRRLRHRQSPFKPDRGHIHHVLMDSGLSPRAALGVLTVVAITFVAIGALARRGLAPGSNLLVFLLMTATYLAIIELIQNNHKSRWINAIQLLETALQTRI